MSAKDRYHDQVKDALIKEKWTITHDPYTVTFGQRNVYVDLGAERILAAEKDEQMKKSLFLPLILRRKKSSNGPINLLSEHHSRLD